MKYATGNKLSPQQKALAIAIFGPEQARAMIDAGPEIQKQIDDQAKQMAQAVKPKTVKPKTVKPSLAGSYFGLNGTSGKEAMITKYGGDAK